jgi:hypothetical protein
MIDDQVLDLRWLSLLPEQNAYRAAF